MRLERREVSAPDGRVNLSTCGLSSMGSAFAVVPGQTHSLTVEIEPGLVHASGQAHHHEDKLVEGGKLEKSWQAVTKTDALEQVDGKRSKEWKLSFKNPAATDKSKDTLYLFYSLPGNFIAANHTGQ